MKAKTLRDRVAQHLTTKAGTINKRYAHVLGFIAQGKGARYHGARWHGHGRTLSDSDHWNLIKALKLIGVDYVTGNDAPRGGREGDYVELTAKGLRQTRELREELRREHYTLWDMLDPLNEDEWLTDSRRANWALRMVDQARGDRRKLHELLEMARNAHVRSPYDDITSKVCGYIDSIINNN